MEPRKFIIQTSRDPLTNAFTAREGWVKLVTRAQVGLNLVCSRFWLIYNYGQGRYDGKTDITSISETQPVEGSLWAKRVDTKCREDRFHALFLVDGPFSLPDTDGTKRHAPLSGAGLDYLAQSLSPVEHLAVRPGRGPSTNYFGCLE